MAKYSTEFKKKIVAEYLKGNIGYGSLAKKYNIPSMNPIATWVAAFQSLGTKGISRSRQKKSGLATLFWTNFQRSDCLNSTGLL